MIERENGKTWLRILRRVCLCSVPFKSEAVKGEVKKGFLSVLSFAATQKFKMRSNLKIYEWRCLSSFPKSCGEEKQER